MGSNRGMGERVGKKSTTNRTHHRSNHLAGDEGKDPAADSWGDSSPSCFREVVYEQGRETPSELVTVQRDG